MNERMFAPIASGLVLADTGGVVLDQDRWRAAGR